MGHIKANTKRLLYSFVCFFFALLFTVPTYAITEQQKIIFKENNIMFWNMDENHDCVEYEEEEEENDEDEDDEEKGNDEWDGHCSSVDSYGNKILQYFDSIYKVAKNNGLPWEGIVAQLIGESSFMKSEVCPYNPLGLKGQPSCDGTHRSFGSYDEAFTYYVNSIRPVREAKNKYTNDPYGYIYFLIHGVPNYTYATDPNYVNKVTGYVCGIQKWAKANGKSISGSGETTRKISSSKNTSATLELPYCDDEDDKDKKKNDLDDEDSDDCEDYGTCCDDNGTCNDYVFPLAGATKSNYLHNSALSPLTCSNLSKGGCHHDYYAMDLGLSTGTKTEANYPDLAGKFPSSYWASVGVKVVAMYSGRITSYKTYSRATLGYQSRCASVTYETTDGRKFWLGHMLYNSKYKAGDTFKTGDVIGEIGPPPCAISTQAHLHVDETPMYGSSGSVETVKLLNKLYEKLP